MQTRGAMSQNHSSTARRRHKQSDAEQRAFRKATLEQYARLEISAAEAMNRLELRCYEDLSSETLSAGLRLPRIERKEALALAEKFVNGIFSS